MQKNNSNMGNITLNGYLDDLLNLIRDAVKELTNDFCDVRFNIEPTCDEDDYFSDININAYETVSDRVIIETKVTSDRIRIHDAYDIYISSAVYALLIHDKMINENMSLDEIEDYCQSLTEKYCKSDAVFLPDTAYVAEEYVKYRYKLYTKVNIIETPSVDSDECILPS